MESVNEYIDKRSSFLFLLHDAESLPFFLFSCNHLELSVYALSVMGNSNRLFISRRN